MAHSENAAHEPKDGRPDDAPDSPATVPPADPHPGVRANPTTVSGANEDHTKLDTTSSPSAPSAKDVPGPTTPRDVAPAGQSLSGFRNFFYNQYALEAAKKVLELQKNDLSSCYNDKKSMDLLKSYYKDILVPPEVFGKTPMQYKAAAEVQDISHDLRKKIADTEARLKEVLANSKEGEAKLAEREGKLEALTAERDSLLCELARNEELGDLLNSLEPAAGMKLRVDQAFVGQFAGPKASYVMSIDIRRSTELMLRATDPALFADFISKVCTKLREVIWDHHGVFDKFTGDGILAFFPDFYSGPDAAYLAVRAAEVCHEAFRSIYSLSRHCFDTVLLDVGLGIGIDYGTPHLVRQWGSLTVVGKTVVYACRLGGAKPGETLLNRTAHAELMKRFADYFDAEETEVLIKHEGAILAYRVQSRAKEYEPKPPDWLNAEATGKNVGSAIEPSSE